MEEIYEQDIIDALNEAGIKAAEEYFPSDMPLPYAVVLVPESVTDASDMNEIIFIQQTFRVELYTRSKNDPLRNKFKRVMTGLCVPPIEFEEESYGKGGGYMTACTFTDLHSPDFFDDESEE